MNLPNSLQCFYNFNIDTSEKQVIVLKPNCEFLMWKLPSIESNFRKLNPFELFKQHYLEASNSTRTDKTTDPEFIAEILEAWNCSDTQILEEYKKLALKMKADELKFITEFLNRFSRFVSSFVKISQRLNANFTAKQIRERWINQLDPSLKNSEKVFIVQDKPNGNINWVDEIKCVEKTCSENYVKNYWYLKNIEMAKGYWYAWNIAKESKKFRKYPASFKNISLLWNNLPKDIMDIYNQTYIDYKKFVPRFGKFVPYAPHEESTAIEIVETGVVNTKEFINDGENLIVQTEEFQYIPSDNTNLATATNNNSAEENEFFPAENFSNLVVNNNVAEENEFFPTENFSNLEVNNNFLITSEGFSNIDYNYLRDMTAQSSDSINPMDSLATSNMQIDMQYNLYDINNEIGLYANDDNDDTGEFPTY